VKTVYTKSPFVPLLFAITLEYFYFDGELYIASALSLNAPGTEDIIISLTSCVLRVAELENQNQKNSRTLSPLLGDTLIWFLTRWSRSYLLLQPSSSIQLSPSLLNAYPLPQLLILVFCLVGFCCAIFRFRELAFHKNCSSRV
jgi:hypothetical protein